ncbi:MAG: hypothetical protein NTZ90_17450 [Proteobacteria bacterium]|nr:hypothetical protein [Pseudomonadota bacterium]
MFILRSSWTIVAFMGLSAIALGGCAVLHKIQLSDVEPVPAGKGTPISVKVSETTVDFRELGAIANIAGKSAHSGALSGVGRALGAYTTLFQFGPRTGTPVFNEFYARAVPDLLVEKCPHGRLTNIISIRETRSYPVVKGEIIRIDALCVR